jgi:small subunit ribosomal protein S20
MEKGRFMAHHKSALKRIQLSEKARLINRKHKKEMREAVKAVLSLESKENSEEVLKKTISILDRMVNKKIIHKNKAANQKSRLQRFVNGLS